MRSLIRFALTVFFCGSICACSPNQEALPVSSDGTVLLNKRPIGKSALQEKRRLEKTIQELKRRLPTPLDEIELYAVSTLGSALFIIGGSTKGQSVSNTWLLDHKTLSVKTGPKLNYSRSDHEVTKLKDGRLLISGGVKRKPNGDFSLVSQMELYDPKTGQFYLTKALSCPRYQHTAVQLDDHRVIILGGATDQEHSAEGGFTDNVEVFNIRSETIRSGPRLSFPQKQPDLVLINSRKIFVFNGEPFLWDAPNERAPSEFIEITE